MIYVKRIVFCHGQYYQAQCFREHNGNFIMMKDDGGPVLRNVARAAFALMDKMNRESSKNGGHVVDWEEFVYSAWDEGYILIPKNWPTLTRNDYQKETNNG